MRYLTGTRYVEFEYADRAAVFDMMYRFGIQFSDERQTEDKTLVRIKEGSTKAFEQNMAELGLAYRLHRPHGLPVTLEFLRRRPAFLLGAAVFAVWLQWSSGIIWDVRIEGNSKTPDEIIISDLAELGCGVGDRISGINFNDLHARYQAIQSDIAWLSVFMDGTVAMVQVRESWFDEREKHEPEVYANVISDCDGIVESVNVFEGQACVKPGDIIRKGQTAISGIVEMKEGETRYEYAAGEVICRVAESINVEINTKRRVKQYSGAEKSKKRLKFFKKSVNLFVNSGTLYPEYDKIYMIEQLCPLGLCDLPIWIEKTIFRECEIVDTVIPVGEASDEAMAELSDKLKNAEGELLSKSVETSFTDGVYSIRCLLYLRRDTGETSEFRVYSTDENQT